MYFDRHTLSLKAGQLSMFTLDGRMRFQLALRPEDEAAFHTRKLREIVLSRRSDGAYELVFWLVAKADEAAPSQDDGVPGTDGAAQGEIPDYVMVEETV